MRKIQIERYLPLGIDKEAEQTQYWLAIVVGGLYSSISFLFWFTDGRQGLYEWQSGKATLIENARMPSFSSLTDGCMLGFVLTVAVLIYQLINHYLYQYSNQGSKCIYLMKRIPNKWEMHKRSLTLPLIGMLNMFVIMGLLRAIYLAVYMFCTPQQCLPF